MIEQYRELGASMQIKGVDLFIDKLRVVRQLQCLFSLKRDLFEAGGLNDGKYTFTTHRNSASTSATAFIKI